MHLAEQADGTGGSKGHRLIKKKKHRDDRHDAKVSLHKGEEPVNKSGRYKDYEC